MKKITLALFAVFASYSMVHAQATILIEAPQYNNATTEISAPAGPATEGIMHSVYLVTATELAALTGTNINSFGFSLENGTGSIAVTGGFTVYLQNTSDVTFLKSTTYTTAITGMTTVYNGNMTVPATGNTINIALPITPNFTYTGGGLYVAYSWYSTGPYSSSNNYATYHANNNTVTQYGGVAYSATGTPVPDMITMDNFRPVFRFGGDNTATNELGVTNITAQGKVAKSANTPQVVTAQIRNSSTVPLTNITVSLAVTGANTFANTKTIASVGAGSVATVTFDPYSPTTQGSNTVTVKLAPNQNPANDQMVWTQSVTCNILSNNPPTGSYGAGVGFPGSQGIISSRFNLATTSTITGARLAISSGTDNIGKHLYGVIMDGSTGDVLATTNTITVVSSMLGTFQIFKFVPGYEMAALTDYNVGLAQPESGHYPMGLLPSNSIVPGQFFGQGDVTGGTYGFSNYGYYGIEPILGPDVMIAQPTATLCRGESITLSGSGASTYTWSAAPNNTFNTVPTPSLANIVVSPTATVVYTLKGTDAAGCTNSVSVTQLVASCVGIYANVLKDANIKLYPNPAVNGKSTVSGLEGTNTITVYNILGEVVSVKNTIDETTTIDLTTQPTGNYLVKITDSNNHSKTIKVINQN